MIEGVALMPTQRAAMTNGEWEAVLVEWRRWGSLEDTTSPTMKIVMTKRQRKSNPNP